ncbi:hypothetical protein H5410_033802 [Solanum commersonii]|uniref:Uncharacterized protein n=1 Tax=Solanum commersonii TaxID=4109 RepID=A0A9J5YRU0_SOLCO|nr:hypothetical protein H5410_033802 [Solanum commersonii]
MQNIHIFADNGEWEILVLGHHIILNDSLFKEIFGFEFSGDISFMHGNLWPDHFKVSLENAKVFTAEFGSDISNFGPLSLGFENRILAHIVATTLVLRKGSLSNISNIDIFVVYCLLKRIIVDSLVDLSKYRPTLTDATYDTRTFSSMGYVLVNKKWYKKESVQSRVDTPRATRISVDSVALLLKEAEHIKLRIEMGGLKKDAIRSVNKILKEVNSIKTGANSAHNDWL